MLRAACARAARGQQVAGLRHHREVRREVVQRLPRRPDREEAEHPQQGAEEEPDRLQRPEPAGGVGQQREQRGAALLVVGVPAGERRAAQPAVGGLGVEDHGLRDHDGPVAGRGRAPAEVEVVAEDGELVVEAAQGVEHAAAHQHPGGVDAEHLLGVGVLALVVLAALQPGLAAAGAGDGDAELQQPLQRRPLAQHRAEHVRGGVVGRARQQREQRLGVRAGVVVQQPHPLGVDAAGVEVREAGADGGRVGRRRRLAHDPLLAVRRREEVGAAVLAAGVDRHGRGDRDQLGGQPVEDRRQPALAVVADQQDRHVLATARGLSDAATVGGGHGRSG